MIGSRGVVGRRIAIHVTQKVDEMALFQLARYRPNLTALDIQNFCGYIQMTRGKVLGTVFIQQAKWVSIDDFHGRSKLNAQAMCAVAGKFCLFLEDAKPIVPAIPFRGRQGIFNVPDELLAG
uniref:Uncharacterized protein n=1 Tax=viral metagenome TaxID=1070528 RepID=A0A6M3KPU7_9ZZZZ